MATAAENLRGMGLMTLGMAGIALGDSVVKALTTALSPYQVMALMGIVAGVLFAGLCRARGLAVFPPAAFGRVALMRNVGEVLGAVGMITALAHVTLTTVTVILQVLPLIVTAGAALFLGERVGWRQWSAIFVGFIGMLIIVRPGVGAFDPMVIFAVLAALGLAIRDLASRAIGRAAQTFQMNTWSFLSMGAVGATIALVDGASLQLGGREAVLLLALLFLVGVAVTCVTTAMRVGDVGVVSPFRYTRLVFGLALGAILFGERPDFWSLVGGAIIVAAGLFTWWRQTRV